MDQKVARVRMERGGPGRALGVIHRWAEELVGFARRANRSRDVR